jgi:prepilin-type N-terminal cleavage/methylation domain-containing protein
MAKGMNLELGGRPGFTLVELLIIIAILGVLVLAGQPMLFSTLTHASLSPAAMEVRTALEFAQLRSITTGMRCRVTFDIGADTLIVEQRGHPIDFTDTTLVEVTRAAVGPQILQIVRHPLRPGAVYRIDFRNEARFHGVDITGAAFGPNSWVGFDRFGVPTDGGTVTLQQGQRQILITLNAVTGRVTVSD